MFHGLHCGRKLYSIVEYCLRYLSGNSLGCLRSLDRVLSIEVSTPSSSTNLSPGKYGWLVGSCNKSLTEWPLVTETVWCTWSHNERLLWIAMRTLSTETLVKLTTETLELAMNKPIIQHGILILLLQMDCVQGKVLSPNLAYKNYKQVFIQNWINKYRHNK